MPLLISRRSSVIPCSSLPSTFLARRFVVLRMQVSFTCFRISRLIDIPLAAPSAIFIAGMLHRTAVISGYSSYFYVQ